MDAPLDEFAQGDGDHAIESLGNMIAGYLVIATIVMLPYIAAFALYRMYW